MPEAALSLQATLDRLPPAWPEDLWPEVQARALAARRKVVVLDDDPTGTQTVHGVPVLTEWPMAALADELAGPAPAVYLLTNSRAMPPASAAMLNRETGATIAEAVQRSGREVVVVSRSDSTLRGHFPGEVAALAEGLGQRFDGWLLIPFFPEGGRYTIDDFHYVAEGDRLTPAGQTEFARDPSFGYRASNLRAWVEEKTGGKVPADAVQSISLEDLRQGGPKAVLGRLLALPRGAVCIVNAADYRDLEVLALALLEAEAAGKAYLFRTAAAFVRVRAGIPPRPLLTRADLDLTPGSGGLVIAGSYVPRTSAQLDALLAVPGVHSLEIRVNRLLDVDRHGEEISRARREIEAQLAGGQTAAVYTSRALVTGADAEASLAIGQSVSDGLSALVRGLAVRPRYLVAKGGITSSDIATRGLGIRRAMVLGQILPGVPVWQGGAESKFPGLPYVVFPGNVGGSEALRKIVEDLM